MTITRAELTGAIKMANLAGIRPRHTHVRALLAKDHAEPEVVAIMGDLDSYPDWLAGKHLDEPDPPAVTPRPVPAPKKPRRTKR